MYFTLINNDNKYGAMAALHIRQILVYIPCNTDEKEKNSLIERMSKISAEFEISPGGVALDMYTFKIADDVAIDVALVSLGMTPIELFEAKNSHLFNNSVMSG